VDLTARIPSSFDSRCLPLFIDTPSRKPMAEWETWNLMIGLKAEPGALLVGTQAIMPQASAAVPSV
jgi:hypothetical protein